MSVLFVFLGILKIILYIILAILCVILLMLGIILFIPIKYRAEVDKNGKLYGILNVTWFFNIVKLDCDYKKGKTKVTAKVLFWTIFGGKHVNNKTKKKVLKRKKSFSEKKEESKPLQQNEINEENTKDEYNDKTDANINDAKPTDNKGNSYENDNKDGFISKVQSIYKKIIYVKDYPNREEIQKLTWDFIKKICNVLKPDIFTFYGEMGFSDPSITGCALGGIYAVSGLIGADVRVKGNFEKEIFEIKLFSKGSFILWSIVWPLIRYIRTKPIWKLVKKIIFS